MTQYYIEVESACVLKVRRNPWAAHMSRLNLKVKVLDFVQLGGLY